MTHERAHALVEHVVASADAPVSVVVVDDHGEVVSALRMTGAALDTMLNARRKAYTAARSDVPRTSALAAKVGSQPAELASFDPEFSFFKGGVGVFENGLRIGAIGVSGLPGDVDEALADAAIRSLALTPG
ncbi:MAG: GlcG/HbpS family heme-binding protein [Gaiella sp.]